MMMCMVCMAFYAVQLYAEKVAVPAAVYLQNLPCPRIGAWSDSACIADLRAQGMIVICHDCSGYAHTSPELETSILEWHRTLASHLTDYDTDTTTINSKMMYFVPEGYTYRKAAVWNFVDHGADGSLEYIMRKYNQYVVPNLGRDSAFVYTDMVNRKGEPIDYNLYLDVVFPTGEASKQVPLLINHSSSDMRQSSFRPEATKNTVYRAIFQIGALTTGYAYACLDHCFNPVARDVVYQYFDDGYTLDDWDGLAYYTACVRYLRSHASEYNLNGRMGCMGISKAAYGPVRLANRLNAGQEEHFKFNGQSNTKPQPWQGVSSTVDVVYAAAGNGTVRIPLYVDNNSVPMITSCGKSDQYGQWVKYPAVVSHMESIDHNHLSLWMEDMGHDYPCVGTDMRTGESRYVLFKRFFDRYLKPDETDTTAILYILPKEGATEVTTRGESRVLAPDGVLPENMMGVSAYEPITVRYMYAVDTTGMGSRLAVTDNNGVPVDGQWTIHMQGTCLTFMPSSALTPGESYRIEADGVTRVFTVTVESEEDKQVKHVGFKPIEDAYTKVALDTKVHGGEDVLKVRYSQYGDWKFYSYLKFVIVRDSLDMSQMKRAYLRLASASTPNAPVGVTVHSCANTWSETTLVSTNRPTTVSQSCGQIQYTGQQTWSEIDITGAVRSALESGQDTLSFALQPMTSSTEYANFVSKEGAASLCPELVVEEYIPVSTKYEGTIYDVQSDNVQKRIEDGEVIIYKNGCRYSVLGTRL